MGIAKLFAWRYTAGNRSAGPPRVGRNSEGDGGMTVAFFAFAAQQGPVIQFPGLTVKGDSTSITIILILTVLTLLPALLLSMTPFVRILVIFHFLRQALGTQTTPTNQTLIGLAVFLTYFVMQPVG